MQEVHLAQTPLRARNDDVRGDIVRRDGEAWYRISGYDRMAPFFVSVVSGHDHWMYVSSTGGLTCGRRDPDHALFPYETDDRIHDACATAGPVTFLRVEREGKTRLWRPFDRSPPLYRIERTLYKNLTGNRLVFEEINHDLGLAFEYAWSTGDRFGFIRRAALRERDAGAVRVALLDGIRNLLPCGVDAAMQAIRSTLIDAYRQAEHEPRTGAGIYTLSSIPTDRAEPSEALRATLAWSAGLEAPTVLLSTDQAEAFCQGEDVNPETKRHGRRADYLVHAEVDLPANGARNWYVVADVALGPADAIGLLDRVADGVSAEALEQDIDAGTRRIRELVGRADGFQYSADTLATARHFSNTLFNIMRGGVFADGYRFPADDFLRFVAAWHRDLLPQGRELIERIGPAPDRAQLIAGARASGGPDLERLALEYLPLTFSRRHGDPSRPWNRFTIDIREPGGSDRLAYEGNWRDIFQNWEALALSHPEYLPHFIAKFVNASTPDGHNPYRITRDGIDWEVLDPDDPWSNIGYWGDHQVVYLLALIESAFHHDPAALTACLDRRVFAYADVPYRLKPYREILADPRASLDFDDEAAARTERRVRTMGSDGRLVVRADGTIHHASLLEKLLVTALARLVNLVPDGGIWMNTQRPEWNDANNALVGYGLSMVTLYHLRRYLAFLARLLDADGRDAYEASSEVRDLFEATDTILNEGPVQAGAEVTDADRKRFMDRMGAAADAWREQVYAGFSGDRARLERHALHAFIDRALALLDDSIMRNRRDDGLYHSYNLLRLDADGHGVEHLQEMLEGQAAVLRSGVLDATQGLELLDGLRASRLYRADQQSYLLYPAVELPGFLARNRIPAEVVADTPALRRELESGRTDIVKRDVHGNAHFNGRFRNADELRDALRRLDEADDAIESVCAVFKYEGIGCIYWHMVSKLLLAVGEILSEATDAPEAVRQGLLAHYSEIKAGIGANKSPAGYGAFPTDPYSHTPGFAGVQQPGMTGQVKEDIISRMAELGVRVRNGRVRFEPSYLRREELIREAGDWRFAGTAGEQSERLPGGSLAFFLCGVPVVYRTGREARIRIHTGGGDSAWTRGTALDEASSRSLFRRDGTIRRIEVEIDPERLAP
jgi:hypothetical protein